MSGGRVVRRLAGAVRTRGPRPVLLAARRVVWALGWLTARWRLDPDFLVVGAQRAGTTTLYRILCEHPGVVRPTQSKGIGYFDEEHHRGRRWYRAHFPLAVAARAPRRADGTPGPRRLTFESSGYYLHHPLAAGRIARALPDVKVVVVVRDPVDRAYSAYRHEHARGFEDRDLADALALEEQRLSGEVERIVADPAYRSHAHRHQAYLARSRYAGQVARFVEALGADRVHVVDAGHLFTDPGPELARLWRFLGLEPWQPDRVEQWNARPSDPMDADVRRRVEAALASEGDELARITGRRPSWETDDVAATGPTGPAGAAGSDR